MKDIADTVKKGNAVGVELKAPRTLLRKVGTLVDELTDSVDRLEGYLDEARMTKDHKAQAFLYRDNVKAKMEQVRFYADDLEKITDKSYWPMPTYGDLLFEV